MDIISYMASIFLHLYVLHLLHLKVLVLEFLSLLSLELHAYGKYRLLDPNPLVYFKLHALIFIAFGFIFKIIYMKINTGHEIVDPIVGNIATAPLIILELHAPIAKYTTQSLIIMNFLGLQLQHLIQ